MKNIFRKNQIIIVALAIMIIIAGYLNYTGKNKDDETNMADFESGEVLDYDQNADTANDNELESDLVTTADGEDAVAEEDANVEEAADATDEDAKAVDATADEKADVSDKDNEELAVSDTGEVVASDDDTDTPGEAVLVSATISSNYFNNAKLEREQLRAKNIEIYNDLINNVNTSEADKAKAVDALINLTALKEKEFKVETLLGAKGFSDTIVTIGEDNVDVIVNSPSVSDQDMAKIEDVVTRNTGVDIAHVVITPSVQED